MFTYNTSLESPYCDNGYFLSPKFCFNYIQEVTGRREMSIKTGIPHLLKENMSWVFLSTHLDVYKKPYWMTGLKITTTGYEPEGIVVKRRVVCSDENDEMVFKGDSYFAVVSAEGNEHHIINPHIVTDRNHSENDPLEKAPLDFHPRFKKFNSSKLKKIITNKYSVTRGDCDINGHVNNLRYSSLIIDNLPCDAFLNGADVCSMDILFSSELHQGDEADISIYIDEATFSDDNLVFYADISGCSFARICMGIVPKGETKL